MKSQTVLAWRLTKVAPENLPEPLELHCRLLLGAALSRAAVSIRATLARGGAAGARAALIRLRTR